MGKPVYKREYEPKKGETYDEFYHRKNDEFREYYKNINDKHKIYNVIKKLCRATIQNDNNLFINDNDNNSYNNNILHKNTSGLSEEEFFDKIEIVGYNFKGNGCKYKVITKEDIGKIKKGQYLIYILTNKI